MRTAPLTTSLRRVKSYIVTSYRKWFLSYSVHSHYQNKWWLITLKRPHGGILNVSSLKILVFSFKNFILKLSWVVLQNFSRPPSVSLINSLHSDMVLYAIMMERMQHVSLNNHPIDMQMQHGYTTPDVLLYICALLHTYIHVYNNNTTPLCLQGEVYLHWKTKDLL